MSFKTTYLLFGLLLGTMALFALALYLGPAKTSDSSYALPSLHDPANPVAAKDIERVEIVRKKPAAQKLVFVRDKETDRWRMAEPFSARVDQPAVGQVVNQVLDARKAEKRDLTSNLADWGLDEGSLSAVITLHKGDQTWTLNLGRDTGTDPSAVVYATSSDQPSEPMAIRRSELANLFKNVPEYREKTLLAESAFDIQSFEVQDAAKKQKVALAKEGEGNQWRFVEPAYGLAEYEPADLAPPGAGPDKNVKAVRPLLDALAAIKVEGEADFVANEVKDMAQYGVEAGKPELLRIEVKRNAGGFGADRKTSTDALLIGKKADDKGDKLYARLENENNVVRVSARNLEALNNVLANPSALRNRDLVLLDKTRADYVELKNAAGQIKLWKPEQFGRWSIKVENAKTQNADPMAVEALLTALTEKRTVEDFPEGLKDADLGFDKPAAVVSLWEEGIQKDEKKDEKKEDEKKEGEKKDEKKEEKKDADAPPKLKSDKPAVRLTFGKGVPGKSLVYVKREAKDTTTVLSVRDSVLTRANDGPLAYLDKSLPSFTSEGEATKVVIVRGGQTYEVEKEKKDDKAMWKIKQPKELEGRTGNGGVVEDRILNELRHLRAEKLIAEKASDSDLERYGLKSPQVKVTVTVTKDKKPAEWAYLFGKETEDKNAPAVYAKQGDRDMIFTVRKDVLATMSSDLADPTVFTVDAAKVTGLKLVGWQDVVGSPFTLELERKAGMPWTVKAPAGFTLEPSKVEGLLAALSNVRAERFVAFKTGDKPEHKLEAKDGALQITLTIEGEKEPVTLTVGGPDTEGKNYHAKSSRLPGDIFLLPKDRFEKVRGKPVYFSTKD